jgi:hypothetical protein
MRFILTLFGRDLPRRSICAESGEKVNQPEDAEAMPEFLQECYRQRVPESLQVFNKEIKLKRVASVVSV